MWGVKGFFHSNFSTWPIRSNLRWWGVVVLVLEVDRWDDWLGDRCQVSGFIRGSGVEILNIICPVDRVCVRKLIRVWRNILKSVHFILQISSWKRGWQKKLNTPQQSQWKILLNCSLRFSIFETLSQRFLATKLRVAKILFFEHPVRISTSWICARI